MHLCPRSRQGVLFVVAKEADAIGIADGMVQYDVYMIIIFRTLANDRLRERIGTSCH